ncbi:MAG: FAD-binding protein [Raoultibacter sp.]
MSNGLSRRGFLKGAAAGVLSATTIGMLGACSSPSDGKAGSASGSYTYSDTIAWDGEYDVVIMGFGGAGAVAAHYSAKSGAKVLLVDVAPEGHEGGNTRYCGQFVAFGDDQEKLMTYYEALAGGLEYDEELLRVFTEAQVGLPDLMMQEYGTSGLTRFRGIPAVAWAIPEYPEFAGGETIDSFSVNGRSGDSALWKTLRGKVYEDLDKVDIWYESPGVALIQDPETKTILGATIDRKGLLVNIRAKNGVVMTCGGFENNIRMVNDYLGLARYSPIGTLYNRGDGIRMALEVKADLWHMGCWEGIARHGGAGLEAEAGERSPYGSASGFPGCEDGSFILVGANGSRYVNEVERTRHGHVSRHGEWPHPQHTKRNFLVMDQVKYDSIVAAGKMDDFMLAKVLQADSLEEIAEKTEMNAETLAKTVERFNFYVEQGEDWEFGRPVNTMETIGAGPYYAFPMIARILNTQGGPRRNAKAEVVDTEGNPIPNLYSAGELGGLTGKNYQGATNMAECIIFGKIAGENAAQEKEQLNAYAAREQVTQSLTYTLGSETDAKTEVTYETSEGEYVGTGEGIGGEIVVKVKAGKGTIETIDVMKENETPDIGGKALKSLPQSVIDAQSIDVDVVSGATITSKAFLQAVGSAIAEAGL